MNDIKNLHIALIILDQTLKQKTNTMTSLHNCLYQSQAIFILYW